MIRTLSRYVPGETSTRSPGTATSTARCTVGRSAGTLITTPGGWRSTEAPPSPPEEQPDAAANTPSAARQAPA
ncbi:hypothetical protein KCMC57_up38120 [Kitasatospora sp. CMC57]|uniref:Uncharacterized protein n=1 Tax=Kitasatospora sp. CMC57 TaxID=3231513 RepID=A0AB33JZJ2_9ACTN